jgi:hypothetical protein
MKLWHAFAAALLAASAVAVTVVATSAATRGSASATHTLTLLESDARGSFSYLDNDPKSTRSQDSDQGPVVSQGDALIFTSELLTKGKQHAGWLHASCTATWAGDTFDSARFTCTGVFQLQGGTLVGTALLDPRRSLTKIAITGGTGVYEGAIGQIDSQNHDNAPNVDTIRFRTS